ncbi:MAG: DUF968 domain-containing protein [Alphaproteobacteria bacterium]|nr:DUF968 domain-containing protein [Alphaproteobacteria bacterium]MBL7097210.1 DUF968 domain-containing protein [Alphaproteobacteria bacterium]
MTGFTSAQLRKLTDKLPRAHVQKRTVDGKQVDYIEGWFAIREANSIFGFSGWDRETVHFERVFERTRGETTTCAYVARVRIQVRASGTLVSREGTGCGSASASSVADAHDRAIKAAETDATKRALATFGNRFGLCLYDKDQVGVGEPTRSRMNILSPNGEPFAADLSPEGFCGALRKVVEGASTAEEATLWWMRNKCSVAHLRDLAPALKTQRGEHFADVLERVYRRRLAAQGPCPEGNIGTVPHPLAPSRIAPGPRIDKAELAISTARRMRDKAHLRRVAALPCLVCQTAPCHAHHIKYAQPHGLGQKVSDEFVVPLCSVHHGELHNAGSEQAWWHAQSLDPLPVAHEHWTISQASSNVSI